MCLKVGKSHFCVPEKVVQGTLALNCVLAYESMQNERETTQEKGRERTKRGLEGTSGIRLKRGPI